jgi:hypothetical protein
MLEDKIQAVVQYGEAKYFSGYKEGYVIGFITGIILGIISVKIFS